MKEIPLWCKIAFAVGFQKSYKTGKGTSFSTGHIHNVKSTSKIKRLIPPRYPNGESYEVRMKDKQKSQLITSGLGGADGAGDHGAGEEGDRGGGRSPGGSQVP